jgi:hypothetical protein
MLLISIDSEEHTMQDYYPSMWRSWEQIKHSWGTLENMLSSYIEMIEEGRVSAYAQNPYLEVMPKHNPVLLGGRETDLGETPDFFAPWQMNMDFEPILNRTLAAWDGLVAAIEIRLPSSVPHERKPYSEECIEASKHSSDFYKSFLQRARIPSFSYMAPGLRLASAEELANQPCKDFDYYKDGKVDPDRSKHYQWYPFLFLRADRTFSQAEFKFDTFPWSKMDRYSSGLYLMGGNNVERPDGAKLLLPYDLGGNGYARTGDGKVLQDHNRRDGLYAPGANYVLRWGNWGENLQVRLELLFKSWTKMVEEGWWKVGKDGVKGDINKFKDADTPWYWKHYFIERTW